MNQQRTRTGASSQEPNIHPQRGQKYNLTKKPSQYSQYSEQQPQNGTQGRLHSKNRINKADRPQLSEKLISGNDAVGHQQAQLPSHPNQDGRSQQSGRFCKNNYNNQPQINYSFEDENNKINYGSDADGFQFDANQEMNLQVQNGPRGASANLKSPNQDDESFNDKADQQAINAQNTEHGFYYQTSSNISNIDQNAQNNINGAAAIRESLMSRESELGIMQIPEEKFEDIGPFVLDKQQMNMDRIQTPRMHNFYRDDDEQSAQNYFSDLDILQNPSISQLNQNEESNANETPIHSPFDPMPQRQNILDQSQRRPYPIRTTLVSSDSLIESKDFHQKGKKSPHIVMHHMMTRMNWISYLKILYDQLEKVKCYQGPSSLASNKQSILLVKRKEQEQQGAYTEKVNRDQYVSALCKIMTLLPLMSQDEHSYRFPQEQAITFIDVQNAFMASPLRQITWDDIIDVLLMVNINKQKLYNASRASKEAFEQLYQESFRDSKNSKGEEDESNKMAKFINIPMNRNKIRNPQSMIHSKRQSYEQSNSFGEYNNRNSPTTLDRVKQKLLEFNSHGQPNYGDRNFPPVQEINGIRQKDSFSSQVVIETDSDSSSGNMLGFNMMGRNQAQVRSSTQRQTEKLQKTKNDVINRDEITISRQSGNQDDETTHIVLENFMSSSVIPVRAGNKSPRLDGQQESKDDGSITIWQKSDMEYADNANTTIQKDQKPLQKQTIDDPAPAMIHRSESPNFHSISRTSIQPLQQSSDLHLQDLSQKSKCQNIITAVSFGNKEKFIEEMHKPISEFEQVGRQTDKFNQKSSGLQIFDQVVQQERNAIESQEVQKQIQEQLDLQNQRDLDNFLEKEQMVSNGNYYKHVDYKEDGDQEEYEGLNNHHCLGFQSMDQREPNQFTFKDTANQNSINQDQEFLNQNEEQFNGRNIQDAAARQQSILQSQKQSIEVLQQSKGKSRQAAQFVNSPEVVNSRNLQDLPDINKKGFLNEVVQFAFAQYEDGDKSQEINKVQIKPIYKTQILDLEAQISNPSIRKSEGETSTKLLVGNIGGNNNLQKGFAMTQQHSKNSSLTRTEAHKTQLYLTGQVNVMTHSLSFNNSLLYLTVSQCRLTSLDQILNSCRRLKFLNASSNFLRKITNNPQVVKNNENNNNSNFTTIASHGAQQKYAHLQLGSSSTIDNQNSTQQVNNMPSFLAVAKSVKSGLKLGEKDHYDRNHLLPCTLDELLLSNNQLQNIQSIKFDQNGFDQRIKKLKILDISHNEISNLKNIVNSIKINQKEIFGTNLNPNTGFKIEYLCIEGNKFEMSRLQNKEYQLPESITMIKPGELNKYSMFKQKLNKEFYQIKTKSNHSSINFEKSRQVAQKAIISKQMKSYVQITQHKFNTIRQSDAEENFANLPGNSFVQRERGWRTANNSSVQGHGGCNVASLSNRPSIAGSQNGGQNSKNDKNEQKRYLKRKNQQINLQNSTNTTAHRINHMIVQRLKSQNFEKQLISNGSPANKSPRKLTPMVSQKDLVYIMKQPAKKMSKQQPLHRKSLTQNIKWPDNHHFQSAEANNKNHLPSQQNGQNSYARKLTHIETTHNSKKFMINHNFQDPSIRQQQGQILQKQQSIQPKKPLQPSKLEDKEYRESALSWPSDTSQDNNVD